MKAVRRLFRPRLDQASREREALSALFRVFRLPASPSTKRKASMGGMLAATRAGLRVLRKTVRAARTAAATKIKGWGVTFTAMFW